MSLTKTLRRKGPNIAIAPFEIPKIMIVQSLSTEPIFVLCFRKLRLITD